MAYSLLGRKMKKVICIKCGKNKEYDVKEIEQVELIKKVKVVYKEKVAYCKDCGEPVWVEELETENVFAPINAYCEMVGLISPKQIQQGLTKYNIGKRPLAQLLGWSEVTIVRFLDGQLPSRTYSSKLLEIFDKPKHFMKLLEHNKDRISIVAYNKAKKAANQLVEKERGEIIGIDVSTYQIAMVTYNSFVAKDTRKVGEKWASQICYC